MQPLFWCNFLKALCSRLLYSYSYQYWDYTQQSQKLKWLEKISEVQRWLNPSSLAHHDSSQNKSTIEYSQICHSICAYIALHRYGICRVNVVVRVAILYV